MFNRGINISNYILRKSVGVRTVMTLLMVGVFLFHRLHAIAKFCSDHGVTVSVFEVFVYALNDRWVTFFLGLCWLLFIADAPFKDDTQVYMLLRSGRKTWYFGQMLFMVKFTLIFLLWIQVVCFAAFRGRADLGLRWDAVFRSIDQIKMQVNRPYAVLIRTSPSIEIKFSLPEAYLMTFSLKWLSYAFVLLAVYLVNMITLSKFGFHLAVFFSLIDLFDHNWGVSIILLYFSPFTLSNIRLLDVFSSALHPSIKYAYVFLGAGIALFSLIGWVRVKHQDLG